jgi:uroporphyrin-III C-methyltransferase/precorrin-2 dehydrogenase/sirohydrochlorin ferrochelatase
VALSGLPLFHRVAGQRVVVLGEGAAAEAKRRLVERAGGVCCDESEAHHARLAFVALADCRAAEAAVQRLRSKGLLVNVADRPDLCDFTLPSVLERGPMVVAIGTGGASAALAKQLRLRLEALLPQVLGELAERMSAARGRLRERWPDASDRRRALDEALTEGGPLDPLDTRSHEHVDDWLAGAATVRRAETFEIQLTSNDPDDLTLRHARLLGTADTIQHEPTVSHEVLARARADAARLPLDAERPTDGLTVVVRAPR